MHNIAQNLEADFNEADLLPKIKEAAIMAISAYIAANAANDDEHMRHLRNLALEGVRVLQGTANQGRDAKKSHPTSRAVQTPSSSASSRAQYSSGGTCQRGASTQLGSE
jgi:hypothetical protein